MRHRDRGPARWKEREERDGGCEQQKEAVGFGEEAAEGRQEKGRPRSTARPRGQSLTVDSALIEKLAFGERIGLSREEWALIGPLLPGERRRGCRPAGDNRPFFEGIMWIGRTGAQWRHLPGEYGKWNNVFRRYRRWATIGVFDTMLGTLAEVVE